MFISKRDKEDLLRNMSNSRSFRNDLVECNDCGYVISKKGAYAYKKAGAINAWTEYSCRRCGKDRFEPEKK